MQVQRIHDGLWRWTAPHPEWTYADGGEDGWPRDVGCVYLEGDDAVVLIDPLVPDDASDNARFWLALDGDVERLGLPVCVLLTARWHERSAAQVGARYGGRVIRDVAAEPRLPGGVVAVPAPPADESLLWIPAHRTLVVGDVILGDGAGGLCLCPRTWACGEEGLARLRARLCEALLPLDVETVLTAHGDPVLTGGRRALARALGGGEMS